MEICYAKAKGKITANLNRNRSNQQWMARCTNYRHLQCQVHQGRLADDVVVLAEAWDLYFIACVLVFVRNQFHPDPWRNAGAMLRGWLIAVRLIQDVPCAMKLGAGEVIVCLS